MDHLINEPIEIAEMQDTQHHVIDNGVKLCFFYHRGLAVGYDAVIYMHGQEIQGEILHCSKLNDNLFKVECVFMSDVEAFKVRMLEQTVHIERYQSENPHLTLEEAANEWIKINGSLFPNK